ncbi:MAG: hypothetical protein KF797_02010, partial [Flavobacteriales bacterium]|nr:hypothetical protein [Flavobacteriales bacterium]
YYTWGLLAKLFGGVVFCLIYFYYYKAGDTIYYFYSGVAMRNLAIEDPVAYLSHMLGDNSMQAWSIYTPRTGKPYQFMFFDIRTFTVVRIASLLALVTFKSFLISTLLMATASFFGVWACYRTFVSYFPQLSGPLATGFLFMPSSVFWGSAILKDTITFSAVCWWVHAVDEVFFKRRHVAGGSVIMVVSGLLMVTIKPYIFMVLLAATLLWLFYFRVMRIRNLLFKFVLLPIAMVLFAGSTLFILSRLGGALGQFSLDNALQSIEVIQTDMVRNEQYGTNSFDMGKFDGTWLGLFAKFPIATNAALFRPYIWECNNFAMYLSGLENTWVLLMAVLALVRAGPRFFLRCIGGIPILLMATVFALLFAFVCGVSTPNFGALVRFKIPMVPFFISTMYIIVYLARIKRALKDRNLRFDLRDFRMGTRHVKDVVDVVTQARKRRGNARMAPSMG